MHERTFRRCCHCDRKVLVDHGLGEWNLQRHEETCLSQSARMRARTERSASRKYRRGIATSGGAVPPVGQLGFDGFDGVPGEVVG